MSLHKNWYIFTSRQYRVISTRHCSSALEQSTTLQWVPRSGGHESRHYSYKLSVMKSTHNDSEISFPLIQKEPTDIFGLGWKRQNLQLFRQAVNVGVKRVFSGIWCIKFILPLFWVIIFVFKSRLFGTGVGGEHLLDLSGCCQSLKVEVTEEIKEQQTVKWWCLEEAGHEDCHAEAAKYTCPCDVQGRHWDTLEYFQIQIQLYKLPRQQAVLA